MNGCSRWTDAITDCALDGTPEPGFTAHLATCPQCQNALRHRRTAAARIDDVLRHSAAIEPPSHGPERVMARIHEQSEARVHGPSLWWRWIAAGGAILAVLIAAVMMRAPRPAPEGDISALSAWRSPTQALLHPPVAAAWATTPTLGQGFFKIQPSGEKHAQ